MRRARIALATLLVALATTGSMMTINRHHRVAAAAAPAPSTYNTVLLALSPTAYWKLTEAAGPSTPDAGTNALNGTWSGTPGYSTAGMLANDATTGDSCVAFSGDDYSTLPANSKLGAGSGDWSWCCWFKRSAIATYEFLYCAQVVGSGSDGFSIGFDNNNPTNIVAELWYGVSWIQAYGTTGLDDGNVHFLMVRYNNTTHTCYMRSDNNADITTGSGPATNTNTPNPFIGKRVDGYVWGENGGTAQLEKIAYWQRFLSDAEVLSLWNAR